MESLPVAGIVARQPASRPRPNPSRSIAHDRLHPDPIDAEEAGDGRGWRYADPARGAQPARDDREPRQDLGPGTEAPAREEHRARAWPAGIDAQPQGRRVAWQ